MAIGHLVMRVQSLFGHRVCLEIALLGALVCAQTQVTDLNPRTWDSLKLSPEDNQVFKLCKSRTDGTAEQIRALLDSGASPSVQGEYNYTALMWTIVRHKPAVARVLLEAGADPEPINAWGRNAMFLAAWEKADEIMEALLRNGANASSCAAHDGWNALHKAAEMGNEKQVSDLLLRGPQLRRRGSAAALRARTRLPDRPVSITCSDCNASCSRRRSHQGNAT